MTDPYLPTAEEIAELRQATLYSYEAGEPPDNIASDWARRVAHQPDGGLIEVLGTLAELTDGGLYNARDTC